MPQQSFYVEAMGDQTAAATIGASAISALTVVAVWGDWRSVAIVAGFQIAVLPFNIWITLVLLARWGAGRAELLRTAVNLLAVLASGHLTGWPFPVWLWLPYVALAFDHLGPRITRHILIAFCVLQNVAAHVDGVSWQYPLAFTVFAVFCSQMSSVRFRVIREMLWRSDEQRRELERAHAAVNEALDRLARETAARAEVELELRQAQKLEAIGRLAAGIAHEINTPVQFVSDSLQFLKEGTDDLFALVRARGDALRDVQDGASPANAATARTGDVDLAYLEAQIPEAVDHSLEGLARITHIVRSIKEFAHPDRKEMTATDLNGAIMTTLALARSEYKDVAEVETDLQPLPLVRCHAGEVNQVLLNLVVNAAHAVADARRDGGAPGQIRVQTRCADGDVVIAISDTGIGIGPEIHDHIFEPFFTTKEVGRGTGQGLAIARTVVQKHGGRLTFDSEVGAGTTFSLRLPVAPAG
jgi:signal transduction histidine kinase